MPGSCLGCQLDTLAPACLSRVVGQGDDFSRSSTQHRSLGHHSPVPDFNCRTTISSGWPICYRGIFTMDRDSPTSRALLRRLVHMAVPIPTTMVDDYSFCSPGSEPFRCLVCASANSRRERVSKGSSNFSRRGHRFLSPIIRSRFRSICPDSAPGEPDPHVITLSTNPLGSYRHGRSGSQKPQYPEEPASRSIEALNSLLRRRE
jgi:hypothetical protein